MPSSTDNRRSAGRESAPAITAGRLPESPAATPSSPVFSSKALATEVGGIGLLDAQAAVYAADAYARVSGKPAVVVGDGPAEALAVAAGLLTSAGDKQPLIAVTRISDEYESMLSGPFGEVAHARFSVDGKQALAELTDAVADALALDAPVHVATADSPDVTLRAVVDAVSGANPRMPKVQPRPTAEIDSIGSVLQGFTKPLILLGHGAAVNADPEAVAHLARTWGAPILLTTAASATPRLKLEAWKTSCADLVLISSGSLAATKAAVQADGILALGTDLSEADWFGLKDVRPIRATIVRAGLKSTHAEIADRFINAEAGALCIELAERLGATPTAVDPEWLESRRGSVRKWTEVLEREGIAEADARSIDAANLAHDMATYAPEETIFAGEGGASGMWLYSYIGLRPFSFPAQHATIGYPIPAAVGVHAAAPDAPVWIAVGDGAFFYNSAELKTLAELAVPAAIFVFNDGSWNAIRLVQTMFFQGRAVGTDLMRTDFAALARLYGCESVKVDRPADLTEAFARAKNPDRRVPLVVDVTLKKGQIPFAGAAFIAAELDGTFKSVALSSIASMVRGMVRDGAPLRRMLRVLAGALR